MKVKTSPKTVEKLVGLLQRYDSDAEQFLDELPTPEKYTILAMALVVRGEEDFEIAYAESMQRVSAQHLTQHLLNYPFLWCHLQDALRLGWSYFECVWSNDEEETED